MNVTVCKINEINKNDFAAIFKLISEGGEVKIHILKNRLLETALIAYSKFDSEIIATAAIKKPNDEYNDSVFLKSKSIYDYNDFNYELGYVYVVQNFRRIGIALRICKEICSCFESHNLYSTVRAKNIPIQKILNNIGFTFSGMEFFNRSKTVKLKLYIKEKNE